jgi:hypothetical protein
MTSSFTAGDVVNVDIAKSKDRANLREAKNCRAF